MIDVRGPSYGDHLAQSRRRSLADPRVRRPEACQDVIVKYSPEMPEVRVEHRSWQKRGRPRVAEVGPIAMALRTTALDGEEAIRAAP